MKKLFLLLSCVGLLASCQQKPEYIDPPAISLEQNESARDISV